MSKIILYFHSDLIFFTRFLFLFLYVLLISDLSENPLTFIHYLDAYAHQIWQGNDMQ